MHSCLVNKYSGLSCFEIGSTNFSNIANDLGVNRMIISEWYQVLVDTLVINEIPGYGKTKKRKAITRSKYYFSMSA